MSQPFHCPACQQVLTEAGAVSFLGLTVSAICRSTQWEDGRALEPLPPRALRMLYEIVKAGRSGAPLEWLRLLFPAGSKSMHVHVTRLREWARENGLPLRFVYLEGVYLLIRQD